MSTAPESRKLSFKPHLLPQVVGEDRVLLLSEGAKYLLRGRLYARIAPLIDGTRTADQIVEALADPKAHTALSMLRSKGYVGEIEMATPPAQAAFWSGLGGDVATAARHLKQATVAVLPLGGTRDDARALSAALRDLDISIADDDAVLTIVVVEDYLQAGLDELNRRMLASGRRWVIVKPVGQILWFGPFFSPTEPNAPCWGCLARRLRCHRTTEAAAEPFNGGVHPIVSQGALPSSRMLAVGLAATEIAKWIAQDGSASADDILTIDLRKMEMKTHRVMRLDECEACGAIGDDIDPAAHADIVLESRPKRFKGDGGDRACPPEETWARLSKLLSPITGIAPDVMRAEPGGELPVYYAKQITPPGTAMQLGELGLATGKGETDLQARISCVGEAVERYSLGFRGTEPRIVASISELGSAAIAPAAIQHFSASQFAERDEWNARNPGFHWIPEPFDEEKRIAWSPSWSLVHKALRWLPTAFCYFVELGDETRHCFSDANGCASGNNREEAILQGFLELVERDAAALFWYNRAKRPGIRLESFDNGYFAKVMDSYARRGRGLAVLDLTTDMEIPVAFALSWKSDGSEISLGLGAHLNPRTAISRALSELNQTEHQIELWNRRRDQNPLRNIDQDREMAQWLRTATIGNQPWLMPDEAVTRAAADFRDLTRDDLRDDIETCIDIVRRNGMDMIVTDLTRTDVGFPVVRVTVPGLRHFWRRFGPGRLYDAPVRMGWIPEPLEESALNPIACFL